MHRTESLCPRFFWTIFTAFWIIYSRELKYSRKMTFLSTESRHLDKREGMLWPAISSVNFRQYVKTSRLRKGLGPCCAEFPHGTVVRGRICNQVPAQLCSNRPNKRWRDQISHLGTKSTQFHDCSQGPSTRPSVGTSNRKPWKRGCLCAIWQWPVGNKRLFKDSYSFAIIDFDSRLRKGH